jgi:hypothetical protein
MLGASPAAAMAAVQMTGFGAYLALTTIMHAVFTTMLGVTLPFAAYTGATSFLSVLLGPIGIGLSVVVLGVGSFWAKTKIDREICALVAFTLGVHVAEGFNIEQKLLPSGFLLEHESVHDAELRAMQEELSAERERHAQSRVRQERAETEARKAGEREQKTESQLRELIRQEKLLQQQNMREAGQQTDAEAQRLRKAIEDREQSLRGAHSEIQLLEERLTKSTAELQVFADKVRQKEAKEEHLNASKRKELSLSYSVHFPRFEFKPNSLRWLAAQPLASRLSAESALKGLHDSTDPSALGKKKIAAITNLFETKFQLPAKVPARICYRPDGSSIQIHMICKRADLDEELRKLA